VHYSDPTHPASARKGVLQDQGAEDNLKHVTSQLGGKRRDHRHGPKRMFDSRVDRPSSGSAFGNAKDKRCEPADISREVIVQRGSCTRSEEKKQ